MNDWVKKGWVNGAVGFIARNGVVVYYKSAGYDNTEMKTPLPKDDIFSYRFANKSHHNSSGNDPFRRRKVFCLMILLQSTFRLLPTSRCWTSLIPRILRIQLFLRKEILQSGILSHTLQDLGTLK